MEVEKGDELGSSVNESSTLSDDEKEAKHFQEIVNAFKYYRTHALTRVFRADKSYREIPKRHQELVPDFTDTLAEIRLCIDHNHEVLRQIVHHTDCMFENKNQSAENKGSKIIKAPSEFDMDKLRSTLKQIVRDWGQEGARERRACYQPVIDAITKFFPTSKCVPSDVHILVPGAGLGRLAFEITRRGYSCQGNEFSLFMLFVSNFILNNCHEANMFTIYPWVHQYCNVMASKDQTSPVTFPDINPSDLNSEGQFSMAAGDFLDIYTEPSSWDCIATVFFLDTAHNVIQYIETIHKILKPGGIWINFGPLLYHFADSPGESSIELPYDAVRNVILKIGFEILEESTGHPATYTNNPRSMVSYEYKCVFMVLRKPQ